MNDMNLWSAIVIAMFSGAAGHVIGALVSWLRNRKGDKAKAAREQKADEDSTKQAAIDLAEMVADAQATAQETATKVTKDALLVVERQCRECREELRGLRDITGNLIDALEALMNTDTPQARADARATIRLARRAM